MKLWCLQGVVICLTAHFLNVSSLLFPLPGGAQIKPDHTLNVNSIVTPNGNTLTIEGGTKAGSNLFHSFEQFSLPTGAEAFFNNPPDVQNIFSRVTGGNLSHIDGLIRANGVANLFLLNPNGIIFGPNARLNLGGSFIASTANSIHFADGTLFSASNPSATPLLTVSVPVGLGMGSNPGAIEVQGTGQNLTLDTSFPTAFPPFKRETNASGLSVQPGRTLALVGGDVRLAGGQLVADRGRIELGSVASGQVSLTATASGFTLGYEGLSTFQDIQLSRQALVDASGAGGGGIHFAGRRVTLTEGAAVLIQNTEAAPAGEITVNATDSVQLTGTTPDAKVRSSFNTESTADGASGDIRITTSKLTLVGGGQIITRTFGAGYAGNITVNASDAVDVIASSPLNSRFFSSIFAISSRGSSGRAGDLTITTRRLTIERGGIVAAAAYGDGAAGNLTLKASEAVELIGSDPIFNSPSDLNAGSFRSGNAGNLTIDTQRLVVRDGARITASSIGSGNAGTLTVNASQFIELSGNSSIESSVNFNSRIDEALGIIANPSGRAGGVTINTQRLTVRDEAGVAVRNIGPKEGGTLRVNAGSIVLDSKASLTASTASGEGGNIILQSNSLQLRSNSNITTTAGGTGNGGNLTINSGTIVALDNSDISANAIQGRGGNISINTNALFGAKFRPQPTLESDITASSEFGISGNVAITNPEVETRSFLVQLPQNLVDPTQQITTGCATGQGNTFTVTGRGGMPEDPSQGLLGRAIWWDDRDLSQVNQTASKPQHKLPKTEPNTQIVEATGWRINAQGQVELVADAASGSNSWGSPANCGTRSL